MKIETLIENPKEVDITTSNGEVFLATSPQSLGIERNEGLLHLQLTEEEIEIFPIKNIIRLRIKK